jgi:hypothetical protein
MIPLSILIAKYGFDVWADFTDIFDEELDFDLYNQEAEQKYNQLVEDFERFAKLKAFI